MNKTKFAIVTGGMISGIGKGVVTASVAKLLVEYGYKTTVIKIDPYLNCDAGTLRPTEHGEVWVTADGGEIDQDLGTYERFLGIEIPKKNSITTGQVYKTIIDRERAGEYLGQTVQFIPHVIDEIMARIQSAAEGFECVVIEVGGTLGDDENRAFLLASKFLLREYGPQSVVSILVSYLPVIDHIGEMKTKPTQQAAHLLSEQGLFPDFIVCRSKGTIDDIRKHKTQVATHVSADCLIAAPDMYPIYKMPLFLDEQGFGKKLLDRFNLVARQVPSWCTWKAAVRALESSNDAVSVGIIGKYTNTGSFSFSDSYVSIYHALMHAAAARNIQIKIEPIDAHTLVDNDPIKQLATLDGILVPGGFGARGIEGKLAAITYARTREVPFLGICYGMQLAAIEYARTVCKKGAAHTTEVDPHTPDPVVTTLPYQQSFLDAHHYGGTMRLGAYAAQVVTGTNVHTYYGAEHIVERHRHRYEINPAYVQLLEDAGLRFSAYCVRADKTVLMECLEISSHPFFIGTQAHPEFMSHLTSPHPLFLGFVDAMWKRRQSLR